MFRLDTSSSTGKARSSPSPLTPNEQVSSATPYKLAKDCSRSRVAARHHFRSPTTASSPTRQTHRTMLNSHGSIAPGDLFVLWVLYPLDVPRPQSSRQTAGGSPWKACPPPAHKRRRG